MVIESDGKFHRSKRTNDRRMSRICVNKAQSPEKTKLLTCLNYQYLLCTNRNIRQILSVNKANVSVFDLKLVR